ncbi:hypothetical protein A936_11574 [Enterobacter sp. Ag1]|nr:hypothetical protein A936_11574 [Enterobacter sp. Ag1]
MLLIFHKVFFPSQNSFFLCISRSLFKLVGYYSVIPYAFHATQPRRVIKYLPHMQAVMLVNFRGELQHIAGNCIERAGFLIDIKEKPPQMQGLNFLYFYFL